jgi:hypothetical protein
VLKYPPNLQKNVIPSLDQSKPLDISLRFYLVTISRFVEAEETIVVVGAIEMIWTDGGISWNPASYGNKDESSPSTSICIHNISVFRL